MEVLNKIPLVKRRKLIIIVQTIIRRFHREINLLKFKNIRLVKDFSIISM